MAMKLKKHQVRRLNDWLRNKRKRAKEDSNAAMNEFVCHINYGKQKAFEEVIDKIREIASEE